MKKLLLAALFAVTLIASAFASPVKRVNSFVTRSFQEDFKDVSDVQWDLSPSFAKATFILDDVRTEAYYDLNGEFIGTCHSISLDELPISAKRSFAKKYSDYTVSQAIEFTGRDETSYYISA